MAKKIPTGINGLDELLNGGIPEGRVVLVIGGPGSGKTTLASQVLYKGLSDYEENGIFVSLDEEKQHYYDEMISFGWNCAKAEEEKKFAFIDATNVSRAAMLREKLNLEANSLRGKLLQTDKLLEKIEEAIDEIGAKRVVVDTLATMFHRFPDPIERRNAVIDLIESFSDLKTTTLITTELGKLTLDREVSVEEYMVHGVIMMQTIYSKADTSRALQVMKMRGTKISPEEHEYEITKKGIVIYP